MNPDLNPPQTIPESSSEESKVSSTSQVYLKNDRNKLLLILPSESEFKGTWVELQEQLKYRLDGGDRFWQENTPVHLVADDRLLDGRQLQVIADALQEFELQLQWVETCRRQTAVAAVTAGYSVEQKAPTESLTSSESSSVEIAEPLYLQTTVRSGVEVRHPGTVIILGDINPGGTVISGGDILVWGRLRGITHAGFQGNRTCRIMALQMNPTQLRIADAVARAPETSPTEFDPEVAYITPEGIRIAPAINFFKTHSLMMDAENWHNSDQ